MTAPSFYLLLDLGGEKEPLPESRQAFEITEARTSGLLNIVFFMSSNWFFEREHPFIDKSMVITELAVSRKLRWCRDLLAAMHMLKKNLLANSKLYYQPLFGKRACAPSPNRRLNAWACYCQLPPLRSLPAQIEHVALINFSWSRFKKGDWCGMRSCFRALKKKRRKKTKKRKEKRKKKSISLKKLANGRYVFEIQPTGTGSIITAETR